MQTMTSAKSSRERRERRKGSSTAESSSSGLGPTFVLLAAAVFGSALGIGAVHVPVLAVVALAVFGACLVLLAKQGGAFPALPCLVCLGLGVYTYVQAIPIPLGALSFLAPDNADVWERSLRPLGEAGPRWASISLDPRASLVEALKWFVYAGVFFASAALGRAAQFPRLVAMVFVSGLVLALVTVAHGLTGASRVFGFYDPEFSPLPWHLGPLLNPNNLAGYLNLAAFCGLGLLAGRRTPMPPWFVAVGTAAVVGCEISSGSRGGFLALCLGFAALVSLISTSNFAKPAAVRQRARMILAMCGGGGLVLAILALRHDVWQELYDKDLSKLKMVLMAKPLVLRHFWFGVGRGAFESVFPVYRTDPGNIVFTHPENFPVQWMSEWGVPVALAALGAFAWSFRPRNMGVGKSGLVSAAWVGVNAVLVQNLFDLGLEIPAVPIAAFAVLGGIWGDRARAAARASEPESTRKARLRPSTVAATAVGVLAIVLALPAAGHGVGSERRALHEAMVGSNMSDAPTRAALRTRIRAAMVHHPAEPYFPLLGATLAIAGRDQDPLPWLARSLEREPVNGGANFLLAQVLASRGVKKQALMELRFAVTSDGTLAAPAAKLAVGWTDRFEDLLSAVPEAKVGVTMLEALAAAVPRVPSGMARPLLAEAIARDPDRAESRRLLAQEDLRELHGEVQTGACVDEKRETCEANVRSQAEQIRRVAPGESVSDRLLADLLVTRGRVDEAEQLLATRCAHVEDRIPCLSARAVIAAAIPHQEPFATAAHELAGAGCGSPPECASTALQIGDLFGGRGEWGRALNQYVRACDADPTETCWRRVGGAAALSGAHAQAAQAFAKAYRLGGAKDAELKQRMESERSKALGTTL
jgi:hypothetical protein